MPDPANNRREDRLPLTEERHLWACAAAIEKLHGVRAPVFIAERIGALAIVGDAAGIERWQAIAARLFRLAPQLRSVRATGKADA